MIIKKITALMLALLLAGCLLNTARAETEMNTAENQADEAAEEQPFLVQITKDDPSVAYVLVRFSDSFGLLPLPPEGEYDKTIPQDKQEEMY